MFQNLSYRAASLLLALALALGSAVTVFAITITVDGDQDAVWTTGSGGQTPGHLTTQDPNEADISDSRDVQDVYWTNDGTYFYLMLQTYGTPSLSAFPTLTQIYFCIDIDNDTATGSTYGNCGMSGIDRYIYISATNSPQVYDSAFNSIGTGTLGYNPSATTPVIEVAVSLADLGLNSSTCTQTIPMAVYFDNGTIDPDDNIPDTGTVNIGCGTPTAITLDTFRADAGAPWPLALASAALAFALVLSAGMALRRRRL